MEPSPQTLLADLEQSAGPHRLVRLYPDQVSGIWPAVQLPLLSAMPPGMTAHPGLINSLLQSCLTGKMTLWIVKTEIEGTSRAVAVGLTTACNNRGKKALSIFCLARLPREGGGHYEVPDETWAWCFERLREYAKANGFAQVMAYSDVPRIWAIADRLGARAEVRILEWEC